MKILAKVYNVRVNDKDVLVNTLLMTRFIKNSDLSGRYFL